MHIRVSVRIYVTCLEIKWHHTLLMRPAYSPLHAHARKIGRTWRGARQRWQGEQLLLTFWKLFVESRLRFQRVFVFGLVRVATRVFRGCLQQESLRGARYLRGRGVWLRPCGRSEGVSQTSLNQGDIHFQVHCTCSLRSVKLNIRLAIFIALARKCLTVA